MIFQESHPQLLSGNKGNKINNLNKYLSGNAFLSEARIE